MSEVLDKVVEIVCNQLSVNKDDVTSDSSFVEIFFKIILSPEAEIAKLFESTKHKCLHILFSDGMYFLKTKYESISFEK